MLIDWSSDRLDEEVSRAGCKEMVNGTSTICFQNCQLVTFYILEDHFAFFGLCKDPRTAWGTICGVEGWVSGRIPLGAM